MEKDEEYWNRKMKEYDAIMKGEQSYEGCLIVVGLVVLLGVLLALLSPFIFAVLFFNLKTILIWN